MGYKIFPEQRLSASVNYLGIDQLERTLGNGEKSCLHHNYDDCMYSALSRLMRTQTDHNCTVPWIRDNDNICTKPKDMNTTFWISWNHVTNQFRDCESPCDLLMVELGAKDIRKWNNTQTSTLTLYFPQKILMTKEHYLYTLLSLLADIGGYMGLLLGYSLFNLVPLITKVIDIYIDKQSTKVEPTNDINLEGHK